MERDRSRFGNSLFVGFLRGALSCFLVTGLLMTSPQTASAITCTSGGGGRGTKVDGGNHYGTGGNIGWRSLPSSGCALVRSLYIWSDANNAAEVGWYQDGSAQSISKCDVVTSPHVFVWANYNGFFKCKAGTSAFTSTSGDHFALTEPNHDGNVDYYWNSTYLGYYNNNFTQGEAWAYDEIHDANTSGNWLAGFNSLVYYDSAGVTLPWYSQPIQTWLYSPYWSSGYKYCDYNAQKWKEILSTSSC